jgi:hypothetical protein
MGPALLDEATRTRSFVCGLVNTPPNEGHPNERGHEVIAREMVRSICDLITARADADPMP